MTWGLGGLNVKSHRLLVAQLADELEINAPSDVADVANRWIDLFWDAYEDADIVKLCKGLHARPAHGSGQPNARTPQEEDDLRQLSRDLVTGFCIGGYVDGDRSPNAYQMMFDPHAAKPQPQALLMHVPFAWGAPAMIKRLITGIDDFLFEAILASPLWTGDRAQLQALASQHLLSHPILPIRDAIDFVHMCVQSTIKAFKFSNLSQICGGPIEIAVITVDRNFRWVTHKSWKSAIKDGEQE